MHSRDAAKDALAFKEEIDNILQGRSPHNRVEGVFDFSRFIFLDANFGGKTFTQGAFSDADEIDEVLEGVDFTQNADFGGATFTQDADFSYTTFTQDANFMGATFTQNADFEDATFYKKADFGDATFTHADFESATFTHNADFGHATFAQNADFLKATFNGDANFGGATFTQNADFSMVRFGYNAEASPPINMQLAAVADFMGARFERPSQIVFHRVNRDGPGMRARLRLCLLEGVRFEDVNWHRAGGGLVLQDELDLSEDCDDLFQLVLEVLDPDPRNKATYEVVADTYRRLVNNFEEARSHELAEECFIGEMEMRRRNPANFPLAGFAGVTKFYEKQRWARFMGQQLSFVNFYRLLSKYGSSYTRALVALGGLVLLFAFLFPAAGLRMAGREKAGVREATASPFSREASVILWSYAARHPRKFRELWGTFKAGLLMTAELSTFQRERTLQPISGTGRALAIATVIAIPGQAALLALALRRRFRR